jgi:hypothetical protein
MVRYAKKNQYDGMEDMKLHRFQRKYRGHKLAVNVGASRQERRGWGYTKRRSVAIGEE